jgi:hypothetical protein
MKNRPTKETIQHLASGQKVNRTAVYNFLGTLPFNTTEEDDLANLAMDARLYRWNEETIRAIDFGIRGAFSSQISNIESQNQ